MRERFTLDEFNYSRAPVPERPSSSFDSEDERNSAQETYLYGADNRGLFGDVEYYSSGLDFSQYNTSEEDLFLAKYKTGQQLELFSDVGDDIFDIATPSLQEDVNKLVRIQSEVSKLIEPNKEKEFSFGILKNFGSKFRGNDKNPSTIYDDTSSFTGKKLSTLEIVRLAGENFIKSFSQGIGDLSNLSHPFSNSKLHLSKEDIRDVELVQDLLSSAEKVDQQQYERASSLLDHCALVATIKGNPIQRLVHYLSLALREKIDRETGKVFEKGFGKKQAVDIKVGMMSPSPSFIAFHRLVPFCQVSQFAGVQAVVDNVEAAKKVHIIDLEIRVGVHWSILMQALTAQSNCPLEHLKITAIGTKAKPIIEGTGNQLTEFARSMNVPFSFNIIMVTDMTDLNADLFDLDKEETVAVYSSNYLWTMIAEPRQLDCLMRVIQMINPCVMVVIEVEANHNTPHFLKRFTETLFYNAALFDSVEECTGNDNPENLVAEALFFSQGIRNIVAAEGEERTIRHVNAKMWRAFFSRFGMKNVELSMLSLYQASLMVNNFNCASSCTLEMEGNCMIIGWKGTPQLSLSSWKFE